MPEVIQISFKSAASQVPAMELTFYRHDELRQHGAPCSLTVAKGARMLDTEYWEAMRRLADALNAMPDASPLRAPEIRDDMAAAFAAAHGCRGGHVLAGGDLGRIDGIRRSDAGFVVAKTLREMRAMGLIAEADYMAGLEQLSERGFAVSESLFKDNKYFKEGAERMPTPPLAHG